MKLRLTLCVLALAACTPKLSATPLTLVAEPPPQDGFEQLQVVELDVRGRPGEAAKFAPRLNPPAVVELWASWCAPCRETMPETAAAVERIGEGSVQWLPVSLDEDPEAARAFLDSIALHPVPLVAVDVDAWRTQLGISELPVLLLVDEHGLVLERFSGVGPDTIPSLEQALVRAR